MDYRDFVIENIPSQVPVQDFQIWRMLTKLSNSKKSSLKPKQGRVIPQLLVKIITNDFLVRKSENPFPL